MLRRSLIILLLFVAAALVHAQPSLPTSFQSKTIHSPEGADIFVRWGGKGPVALLLHGYAENSDSWAPLAADLMKDHTVVVPDLRGIGRASKPAGGYDKKTEAKDIRAVVTALGYDRTFVVAHDIGNMVAYAYAAMYPDKVERLVVMDAPIPGIEPWAQILRIREFGISIFMAPMLRDLSPAESASILIAYGMTSLAIRQNLTTPRETSSLRPTRNPEACGLDSRSSRPFLKMRPTTKSLSG